MNELHDLKPERYTRISHSGPDLLPDLESLGLLVHYLRHNKLFHFTLASLVSRKSRLTKEKAAKARATLIRYRFLVCVSFRHSRGGKFHTHVYRFPEPATDEDLATIVDRYRPGRMTQIPMIGSDNKPVRDGAGELVRQPVTIQWASVESHRGEERIDADGAVTLLKAWTAKDKLEKVEGAPEPPAEDDSAGAAAPASEGPEDPAPEPVDNSEEDPGGRVLEIQHPERPGKTPEVPGAAGCWNSGEPGIRAAGNPGVFKKTTHEDQQDQLPGGQAPLTPPTDDMPGKPGVPSTGEPEPDLTARPTTQPVLEGDPLSARARSEARKPARPSRAQVAVGGSSTAVRRFARQVEAMPDLVMPSTVRMAEQPEWRMAAGKLYRARQVAGRLAADAVRENSSLPLAEVEKLVARGGIEGQDPGEVVTRAVRLVEAQRELDRMRGGPLPADVHQAAVLASARWAAQSAPVPAGADAEVWRAAVTELELARAGAGPDASSTVARNLRADRPFVCSLITNRMGRLPHREVAERAARLVQAQERVDVLAGLEAPVLAIGGVAVTA